MVVVVDYEKYMSFLRVLNEVGSHSLSYPTWSRSLPYVLYLRVCRAVMVDGMSIREVSRVFGLHRDTVRKILAYSAPPGYRRQTPPRRPKLEPFTGVIDQILVDDLRRPRKQRHTAQRIFRRLRDEHGLGHCCWTLEVVRAEVQGIRGN